MCQIIWGIKLLFVQKWPHSPYSEIEAKFPKSESWQNYLIQFISVWTNEID